MLLLRKSFKPERFKGLGSHPFHSLLVYYITTAKNLIMQLIQIHLIVDWLFAIIFYRVFFLIAEICLLAGSVRNAYHTKYRTIFSENPPSCQTLRKGVFGAGAAFIFFTAIVSEFYYVCYSRARESFQSYGGETGVGMGTYKWAFSRAIWCIYLHTIWWFFSCILCIMFSV